MQVILPMGGIHTFPGKCLEDFYFVEVRCGFFSCKVNGCQSKIQFILSNLTSEVGCFWQLGDARAVLSPWHQNNSLQDGLSHLSYLAGQQARVNFFGGVRRPATSLKSLCLRKLDVEFDSEPTAISTSY